MTREGESGRPLFGITIRKLAFFFFVVGIVLIGVYGTLRLIESGQPVIGLTSEKKEYEPLTGQANSSKYLRFAVATMVSAEATFFNYNLLVQKICRDIGRQEAFVLRPSYTAVRQALEQGQVDVAFVCTGTYVHSLDGNLIQLLAQPEFEKGMEYRSLLIVPVHSTAAKLKDLQGGVMAFTDPESNTGRIVPTVMMAEKDYNPNSFFKKIMYTGSHDRSIRSVALGIVDVASVDSLVLESIKSQDPPLANRVRVLWKSQSFGPPPIVVPKSLNKALKSALLCAFTSFHNDDEGRKILNKIGIKRFIPANKRNYQTAITLFREFSQL